ncbi:hypothetical protein HYQ46_000553 [Verticillium longisporum]|nr:hypothetical protein HYQ46_000553 [Verticillium longisporum]
MSISSKPSAMPQVLLVFFGVLEALLHSSNNIDERTGCVVVCMMRLWEVSHRDDGGIGAGGRLATGKGGF